MAFVSKRLDLGASGLWQNRNFMLFWCGQSVSIFGSQITLLALPILAVGALNATPAQMGYLGAAGFAPFPLFGLLVGVLVDRAPRRPAMMTADVGRGLLLVFIWVAAASGSLTMVQLYVAAFLNGAFGLLFEACYHSYLPTLVSTNQLAEGNRRLQISSAFSQIAGPGLAGVLIQLVTAPAAMLFDAASFLVSATSLGLVSQSGRSRASNRSRNTLSKDMVDGLRALAGNSILLALTATSSAIGLFYACLLSVYFLYLVRVVGLSAPSIGLIMLIGNVGGLVGALLTSRTERLPLGRLLASALFAHGLGAVLLSVAHWLPYTAAIIGLGQGLLSLTFSVYYVNQVTLRQSGIPLPLRGRVNGSFLSIVRTMMLIGSIAGGVIAARVGVQGAMILASVGLLATPLWIVRVMRKLDHHEYLQYT